MHSTSEKGPTCLQPTGRTFIDLLGKTHVLDLLHRLLHHETPSRFNELKRALNITATTLSRRLDALVDHGLVHREVYAEVPARVEYTLTERGKTLRPVLRSLFGWVDDHMGQPM
jgi:DNA-binding HxlR family transcriptional regulator